MTNPTARRRIPAAILHLEALIEERNGIGTAETKNANGTGTVSAKRTATEGNVNGVTGLIGTVNESVLMVIATVGIVETETAEIVIGRGSESERVGQRGIGRNVNPAVPGPLTTKTRTPRKGVYLLHLVGSVRLGQWRLAPHGTSFTLFFRTLSGATAALAPVSVLI